MRERICCLNSFVLRMIAIVTMVVDHVGAVMFPQEMMFRYIGRIAFPIFVFLLVEGFVHTRNLRKYEISMVIFAFLSEIPFDRAFSGVVLEWQNQNVFLTLAIGLIMLDLYKRFRSKKWLAILILIAAVVLAEFLRTDYGGAGVCLIFLFYLFRDRFWIRTAGLFLIAFFAFGIIEVPCMIAVIPMFLYNGKKGPSFGRVVLPDGTVRDTACSFLMKYVFYAFYPIHLLVLSILAG